MKDKKLVLENMVVRVNDEGSLCFMNHLDFFRADVILRVEPEEIKLLCQWLNKSF